MCGWCWFDHCPATKNPTIIIEQDHRFIKHLLGRCRPSKIAELPAAANAHGIEVRTLMIRKGSVGTSAAEESGFAASLRRLAG